MHRIQTLHKIFQYVQRTKELNEYKNVKNVRLDVDSTDQKSKVKNFTLLKKN